MKEHYMCEDAIEWLEVVRDGCFDKDNPEYLKGMMDRFGCLSKEETDYILKVLQDL